MRATRATRWCKNIAEKFEWVDERRRRQTVDRRQTYLRRHKANVHLKHSKNSPLDCNRHAKLVHWLLHLVQQGGAWVGCGPTQYTLLAVPNVTAHPSTASVPITVLLYDGPLLCGFSVAIKGLSCKEDRQSAG